MIGAIELGGTKCVCAVFEMDGTLIERLSVPTETPAESMPSMINFFKKYNGIKAFGFGSFGPIGANPNGKDYGFITNTPKLPWQHFDFLGAFKKEFDVPMAWTTDVNAAAYGEMKQGAARGVENCMYITIGTGVGAGVVVGGKIISGFAHPEAGHISLKRHPEDHYEGKCPFHLDCLEGMAAGPAIEARWGKKGIELSNELEVWNLEAYYIAQAIYNYYLILSTERFILGGGVMKQRQLFPMIREHLVALNNNYVTLPELEGFIVPPALEDNAGITGCYELAKELLEAK